MADIIKALEAKKNENIPDIQSGDNVSEHVKIKEGDRERIQEFKGTVIRLRKGGNDQSITVRRMASNGIGVGLCPGRVCVPVAGFHEAGKQGMRLERLRLEFRMELDGYVPRVGRQLDDLHELSVERSSRNLEPFFGQGLLVEAVELVPVTVPLVDDVVAIELTCPRAGLERTGIRSQPHRAAEVVDAEKIPELVDQLDRRVGAALGRVGLGEPRDVPGKLDRGPLESVANPEVGDAALEAV